nr:MAG: hypothetical protein [Lokiarchaeota virus Ratatoskr Meg22_1012]
MVKPNTEVWQWESGFTPQKEGTVFGEARNITFRAEDDIQYLDAVALYSSGSTWNFSKARTVSEKPSVCAAGADAKEGLSTIGIALSAASSGNAVTVQLKGVVIGKTNTAISCGDRVRASLAGTNEKLGTVHKSTVATGDSILGIALNNTEAPATAGTGTTSSPFNMRPVAILLMQSLNMDNK